MSESQSTTISTPAIERANRLISLKSHPGFIDVVLIAQDLVNLATNVSVDYPGWDSMQMVVLKCRAQAAKEFKAALLDRIQEAINQGILEGNSEINAPLRTPRELIEQADYVRQAVLEKFSEMDSRPAGSF